MKDLDDISSPTQAIERKLSQYFAFYEAKPSFKVSLQNKLAVQSVQQLVKGNVERKMRTFLSWFRTPRLKWVMGLLLFIVVLFSIFTYRPARAAIERLFDIGYVKGVGFVRVSETSLLNGTTSTVKPERTLVIDQVVATAKDTQIWFHETGTKYSLDNVIGKFSTNLNVDGQEYPLVSWSWDTEEQKGTLQFNSFSMTKPTSITLHISPDWVIPIRLIPMTQMTTNQSMTIYPDACQINADINLCVRAFVADSTGYHLWLSASSANPVFYLPTLETSNPLTGNQAELMNSSGFIFNPIYPSEAPFPLEVPVGVQGIQSEVTTTLSFDRSNTESDSLTLLVSGLTVKTSVSELVSCDLGEAPQVGDRFSCEMSINIAGAQINFREGNITQNSDGIRLMLLSDPIQPSNGRILSGVDLEKLSSGSSYLVGSSFNVDTNRLEIWIGLNSFDSGSLQGIQGVRITDAYLTILEPFRLTWNMFLPSQSGLP